MNTDIEELDLSDNAFGPIGVPGFGPFLEKAHNLKVLKLMNDGLGPEGGRLVAQSLLAGGAKLKQLWIGRNRLEKDGIHEISKVVS